MKVNTKHQGFAALQDIAQRFANRRNSAQVEIEKIQSNNDYTPEAKVRKIKQIHEQVEVSRVAATTRLNDLRQSYKAYATEQSRPYTIAESGTMFTLTRSEMDFLQSLQYLPIGQAELQAICEHYAQDPTATAMRAALQKYANDKGFEVQGLFSSSDDMMKEFETQAKKVDKILSNSSPYESGREFWEAAFMDDLQAASDDAYTVNNDGSVKVQEVKVTKVPETLEEEITQNLKAQLQEENKPLTLAEELEVEKAFNGEEGAEKLLRATAEAQAADVMFRNNYSDTPAEVTAKEQTERITLGGAVE